jgi:transglutaminase-like putative cysteine protease
MFFWDFGKGPEQSCYKVHIEYRLECYEVHAEVDPNKVGSYDKTSEDHALYTRSTNTICITPKVKDLGRQAVGDEKNPYLQAEKILKFVWKNVRYKVHRLQRGVGTKLLLSNPVRHEKTGQERYEGECGQKAALFVALCRSVGIPARCVCGLTGHRPWVREEDLKLYKQIDLQVSPRGLAGTQHYLAARPHMWAEFYIPNYGWIPADPTYDAIGYKRNKAVIMSKARDVRIGPNAPRRHSEGYGYQWVAVQDGRADALVTGVWNIANIRTARAKLVHRADPFPSDAFAGYALSSMRKAADYRRQTMSHLMGHLADASAAQEKKSAALARLLKETPKLRRSTEPFICHMLREVVGDDKFVRIFESYIKLRTTSGKPVSTTHFREIAEKIYGKPLDWFFEQWLERSALPQLKLERITVSNNQGRWNVRGNLSQLNDRLFRLPVRIDLYTPLGTLQKTIWLQARNAGFEFSMPDRPTRIVIDPELDILKIQKMPPLLSKVWSVSRRNWTIIYGTTAEAQVNRAAARQFGSDYLGWSDKLVKADADVNEADLEKRCIFLFGRPEANKITQQLKNAFPIRLENSKFTWQGKTYDKPTHSVAQIINNPDNPKNLIVLYAGLSDDATQKLWDLTYYASASYVIFDKDEELTRGGWIVDEDLFWEMNQDISRSGATTHTTD